MQAQIVALPVYDADSFLKSHSTFAVAAWRDYDSWWFHSWSDKKLKIDGVEKVGALDNLSAYQFCPPRRTDRCNCSQNGRSVENRK